MVEQTPAGTAAESQWLVECYDPFGRDRGMTVLAADDHVVMVSPAGESAVLSASQTRALRHALTQAAARVRGRDRMTG